jgi:hypothetical protein
MVPAFDGRRKTDMEPKGLLHLALLAWSSSQSKVAKIPA